MKYRKIGYIVTYNRSQNLADFSLPNHNNTKCLWKIIEDGSKENVEHLEDEDILTDTLGSCRPTKMTWENVETFTYDVYVGFQNNMETVAVVGGKVVDAPQPLNYQVQ